MRITESTDPFSTARVRTNLVHFAIGKSASAILNIALLLTVVRTLPVADYGAYITLLAMLEIAILFSDGGANAIAQRYVSEARLPENLGSLPRLIWTAMSYRILTVLLTGGALAILAPWILHTLKLAVPVILLRIYLLATIFEGVWRYCAMIFDSLLEQRLSRIAVISWTGGKLVGVLGIIAANGQLQLKHLVVVDVTVTVLAAALSVALLIGLLRRLSLAEDLTIQGRFPLRRMVPFALQMYAAQCIAQIYGPNAIKLLITRLLGTLQAAVFGFAHALTFFLQQYLPSQLLAGLIRPVLVARRAGGAGDAELAETCNLVLKINHFLIVPVIAFFAVQGSEFAAWLSNGKYAEAGSLLFWLSALLVTQSLHFILSLMTVALEHRSAVFWGTVSALPGVGIGIALLPDFGAPGMVAGLWLSELLWCLAAWNVLRASGFIFRLDGPGWIKVGSCGLAGAMAGVAVAEWVVGLPSVISLACVLLGVFVGYGAVAWLIKPFNDKERARINRLLPRPWFVF